MNAVLDHVVEMFRSQGVSVSGYTDPEHGMAGLNFRTPEDTTAAATLLARDVAAVFPSEWSWQCEPQMTETETGGTCTGWAPPRELRVPAYAVAFLRNALEYTLITR